MPRLEDEADYTCRDLDYSGYHKNLIQLLFIITVTMTMTMTIIMIIIIIIIVIIIVELCYYRIRWSP